MPEISDADYAQQQALLKLFDQVWNDPNVGQNVRRRAKELRPEINIPDDRPGYRRDADQNRRFGNAGK